MKYTTNLKRDCFGKTKTVKIPYKRYDLKKDKSLKYSYGMRGRDDNNNLNAVDGRLKAIFNGEFKANLK